MENLLDEIEEILLMGLGPLCAWACIWRITKKDVRAYGSLFFKNNGWNKGVFI